MRPYARRTLLLVLGMLAEAPLARAQNAQSNPARREFIQRGVTARDSGDHAAALDLFLRAGAIEMRPGLRLSIAQERRALRQTREACEAATQCMADLQGDLGSSEGARIMTGCAEIISVTCTGFGRVRVTAANSVPAGTELRVQGRAVALSNSTATVFVDPGTVPIEASSAGQVVFSTQVNVARGAIAAVSLDLAPVAHESPAPTAAQISTTAAARAAATPTTAPAPTAAPALVDVTPHPAPPASTTRSSVTSQWWFWTALSAIVVGGTVAGLAAGGVFDYTASPAGGALYSVDAITVR